MFLRQLWFYITPQKIIYKNITGLVEIVHNIEPYGK